MQAIFHTTAKSIVKKEVAGNYTECSTIKDGADMVWSTKTRSIQNALHSWSTFSWSAKKVLQKKVLQKRKGYACAGLGKCDCYVKVSNKYKRID